jgi:hypothetical protein
MAALVEGAALSCLEEPVSPGEMTGSFHLLATYQSVYPPSMTSVDPVM